ncbi:MAG: GH3 auxin-responsive promoter family protein [Azonexus sp.]
MRANCWPELEQAVLPQPPGRWLEDMLARNAACAYLAACGSPLTLEDFRARVPLCSYEDLTPWLARLQAGEADVLFAGRPVAYERTGGSSGGAKLIPYSARGLADFQAAVVPWLAETVREHGITGSAYFSISPATRPAEDIGGIPLGLPDAAYLGAAAGRVLLAQSAVSPSVAALGDVAEWRRQTLAALRAASDLELISVWSPTFLLRLLDDIADPLACWPRLKLVSCWASSAAVRYAEELQARLPGVRIQPKGLLSTECVVSVPDAAGRPVLTPHGFYEFARAGQLHLADELTPGETYEVVVTTASGLYRYQTGDQVRYAGRNVDGRAILEFIGRGALTSDLVGEKLDEPFVTRCLADLPGFAMLLPDAGQPGYVLVAGQALNASRLAALEAALETNPQYTYARRLGQLAPLRAIHCPDALGRLEQALMARGVRLGDVKPLALRREEFWLPLFEEKS